MKQINHYNILLVDDEHFLRESIKRSIKTLDNGFIVADEAASAQEALEKLRNNLNFQLVITDIRMPIMDGLELAKHIQEEFPSLPVIILTGYPEFEYARTAIRNGVVDYLLKPVDNEALENALENVRLLLHNEYDLTDEMSLTEGKNAKESVEYALRYMQTHYSEEIDIARLAEELGFHQAYLAKLFSRYVGKPPLKYLTDIRLRESMRLLQETDLSIQTIGVRVGYQDQFHFSKTFRKHTGQNPTQYRKAMRTKDETL